MQVVHKPFFLLRWYVILIAAIAYWPVGLGLLAIRVIVDWRTIFRLGNLLRLFGGVFMGLFGIIIFGVIVTWSVNEGRSTLIIFSSLFLFIPGALMFWSGTRIIKKTNEQNSIPPTPTPEHIPEPSRPDMDEGRRAANGPVPQNHPAGRAAAEAAAANASSPGQPKMITCPGCGAQSSVPPNSTIICEYCNSTISYS